MMTALPAAMPLPTSTSARVKMPVSRRPWVAPSAARRPISFVRRATLTDISEKIPAAERNSPSATTVAIAPARTICGTSCRQASSSSGRMSSSRSVGSRSSAMARRRGASAAGSPPTRTPITSGKAVAGDTARNTYGASPRSVGVMPTSRTTPTISSHGCGFAGSSAA